MLSAWQPWALLSAASTALTAILAKVGVEGVGPDLATFVHTAVVLLLVAAILAGTGQWRAPGAVPGGT